MDFLYSNKFINNGTQDIKLTQWKFRNLFITERSTGKKSEDDQGSALPHARSQMGCRLLPPSPKTRRPPREGTAPVRLPRCGCYLHSSRHLGKVPSLAPLSNLGSLFAQVPERIPSLGEAWLSLKPCMVIEAKRRLHWWRAKPEGALQSQLRTSATQSTARRHWQSKAGGVWKRPERLSTLLASYRLRALFVNLLVGIQKGKAGPCVKAWTICM